MSCTVAYPFQGEGLQLFIRRVKSVKKILKRQRKTIYLVIGEVVCVCVGTQVPIVTWLCNTQSELKVATTQSSIMFMLCSVFKLYIFLLSYYFVRSYK